MITQQDLTHQSDELQSSAARLSTELETEGIVVLPALISDQQLRSMETAFAAKLNRIGWNNFDGYHKSEPFRHMVEDVLMIEQGFVDIALHPLIKQILNRYLGTKYELTEAKGWKSLPTKRDFHGWHGDAWYDQATAVGMPKEVKLAFYLSDVHSGAFNFISRSHGKQHPRPVLNQELTALPASRVVELTGCAGTAFLFDTSGIHRQGVPMLEERRAVFYNYHDPDVSLQQEDLDGYRYHPLLLNAAFLGNLSAEDHRILGFGNKQNFIPAFQRPVTPPRLYKIFCAAFDTQIRLSDLRQRVSAKMSRMLRRG
ncbi:MAG TPA: phytanoyl-CoA dioxygenase family protein [Pyrinomonadaceae bacterium]|nr:phytanoyl-CoA dioxygenase family protein [Pyrinomonadaceae bacterium]